MIKRIYKLGSLEHNIFPSAERVRILKDILESGSKTKEEVEIIYGPDLEVIELSSEPNIDEYIVTGFTQNNDGSADFHCKKVGDIK